MQSLAADQDRQMVPEQSSPAPSPAWLPKTAAHPDALQTLMQHLGCPSAIAQILVTRGIDTPAAADAFLNPTFATLLDDPAADPAQMLGMAAAVERILKAIHAGQPSQPGEASEHILIYGDYDVDGTTATVLLKTTIERIALAIDPTKPATVTYHVPHRIREGYGMQSAILAEAAAAGIRLVISVDTGIRAIAEATEARSLGLDLIVTDHHLPGNTSIPDALAVLNPNQPGCPYPNKNLCGAAVAFKLAQALLVAAAPLTPDPDAFHTRIRSVLIPSFLKLVAIATIADSVPLTGENRTIVALGLAALAKPVQPGLRALMLLARIPPDRAPTATEVGFRLAPRINAAGRMDIASDVVELFITRNPARAHELALKLDNLNQDRRTSEAHALEAIDQELLRLIDAGGAYPADCIILDHPDWHRGVLGILASRVVDRTGRPALILTHADGHAHGSGRSIAGFHLLNAITAVHVEDPTTPLFERFGGHAHAVGFSLPSASLPLLRARMNFYSPSRLTASLLLPQLDYDAELSLADITPELAAWIARCAPFGIGNPEPIFLTRNAIVAAPVRLIQDRHVCLQLMQTEWMQPGLAPSQQPGPVPSQQPSSAAAIPALGWSRGSTSWPALCAQLSEGSAVDILYRIRKNTGPYASTHLGGLELELCTLRPASAAPLFTLPLCDHTGISDGIEPATLNP